MGSKGEGGGETDKIMGELGLIESKGGSSPSAITRGDACRTSVNLMHSFRI